MTQNPLFYSALTLKVQRAALAELDIKIEREKPAVQTRLDSLSKSLIENLLKCLEEMTEDSAEYESIKEQIDFKKL